MNAKAVTLLKKEHVQHLVRAISGLSDHREFVVVGTGAVIGTSAKPLPADLMRTREIDVFAADTDDPDIIGDLIDGSIGEGSMFDRTFGYYAHGVGPMTAMLPAGWRERAMRLPATANAETFFTWPDADDIAVAKLCAWREKDRAWLKSAARNGIVSSKRMRQRLVDVASPPAPSHEELGRRLQSVEPASAEKPQV